MFTELSDAELLKFLHQKRITQSSFYLPYSRKLTLKGSNKDIREGFPLFIRLRQTAICNNSSLRPGAGAVDLLERETGAQEADTPAAGAGAFSPCSPSALARHRRTSTGQPGKLHPTAEPTSPTKAAFAASREKDHHRPGGARCPLGPLGPGPPPRSRTADQGSHSPGGGRGGLLGRAGSPQEDCGATGGMGAGTAGAVRRPPQPDAFHLASAAAEAARPPALSTAPSRGGGRSARPAAAPDHHLSHVPTPSPASPGPRGATLSAGRASTAGEGDYARALARSPPRCSRPVPRRVP